MPIFSVPLYGNTQLEITSKHKLLFPFFCKTIMNIPCEIVLTVFIYSPITTDSAPSTVFTQQEYMCFKYAAPSSVSPTLRWSVEQKLQHFLSPSDECFSPCYKQQNLSTTGLLNSSSLVLLFESVEVVWHGWCKHRHRPTDLPPESMPTLILCQTNTDYNLP